MKVLLQVATLVALAAAAAGDAACKDDCLCPTGTKMLCGERELKQVPAGDWPQITSLSLTNNDIEELHLDSFAGFPNVESINLWGNPLTKVDFAVFASLTNLRNLNFRECKVNSVISSQEGFSLENLEILFLNFNNLSYLDPDILAKVAPNLSNLEISNNPLVVEQGKAVINHPKIFELSASSLKELNLGPQSFAQLPNVYRMFLSGSGISDISGAFATNSRLNQLYIGNNKITEVHGGSFPSSGKVYILGLDGNPGLSVIEPAALADAMQSKGYVQFSDTALACSCDYVGLYWWAKGKGVYVNSACQGDYKFCSFA